MPGKNIIKEADAKGGPFPPHSTKNNMEGFDLPMGLFASKNVVDISGKESTYKNSRGKLFFEIT